MARGNDNMKGRIALFEICGESSRVILRESQVLGENHCVFGGDMEWMMGGEEGPVVDGRLSQSAFGSSASGNICKTRTSPVDRTSQRNSRQQKAIASSSALTGR